MSDVRKRYGSHPIDLWTAIGELEAENERLLKKQVKSFDTTVALKAEVKKLRNRIKVESKDTMDEIRRLRRIAEAAAWVRDDPAVIPEARDYLRAALADQPADLDRQLAETDVDDNHAEDLADQPTLTEDRQQTVELLVDGVIRAAKEQRIDQPTKEKS